MATRPLTTAEALPAFEPLEGSQEVGRRGSWARGALLLDAAMLVAAALATQLGAADAGVVRLPLLWLLSYPALVVLLLRLRGMYDWRLRLQALDDLRTVITTTVLAAMILLTLRFVLAGDVDDLTAQTLRLWAFSAFYLGAGRVALDWSQVRARRERELAKPTLIIGAGRIGRLAAQRLLDHPEFGLRPVGFIDKEPLDEPGLPVPVLGASWDLERLIEQHGIEHVVVTFSTAPSEVLLREARRCEELGVAVSLVPRLFERVTERLSVEHIGGLPLLSTKRADPKGWQFAVKYAADRAAAALLLLACLPVLAAAALAVRLSVGSPIFFRQRRVGRDGKEFDMLKLRTMRGWPADGEADADWAQQQLGETATPLATPEDRTTATGRFLRAFSIDELPQLVNVLTGEMSLVGPRPERVHYVHRFEKSVYRYGDRHRVKSGITGWAQVHGLRGKTSLSDRVEWDNYYIENWSLWLDVKILLMTLGAVVGYFGQGEQPSASPEGGRSEGGSSASSRALRPMHRDEQECGRRPTAG
jgi:exopolysaccharide biosynthesis polyprenyl glycosylphosphotransferase